MQILLPTSQTLGIMMPRGYEWLVILALGLLIFGKRLPGAARGIGQAVMEFKRGFKSGGNDEADEPETAEMPKPRFDTRTGKPLAVESTSNT